MESTKEKSCNGSDTDDSYERPELNVQENLSSFALAALNEFLAEKTATETTETVTPGDGRVFVSENFRFNQFWYDDSTAEAIAKELLHACQPGGRIGLLSAPRAMTGLKALAAEGTEIYVFEIDERFGELYEKEFVKYNLYAPEKIPNELHHTFDVILFDPPFHNKDALEMYKQAIDLLGKGSESGSKTAIFACTGCILRDFVKELFDANPTSLECTFDSKFCNPSYLYSNCEGLLNLSYI